MSLRICMPWNAGRGAGLGNELIPWARAYVAATVLGAELRAPAFGLNQRRYWRHFGTPRHDWLTQRALAAVLPVVEFSVQDYADSGSNDLPTAIRQHAARHHLHERRAYLWRTSGMWGGYHHLAEARDFVRATLHRSRFAPANLLALHGRLDPARITVGMHVRLGDFLNAEGAENYRSRFNVALPLAWYVRIAQGIREQLGEQVQFLVVSDGTPEQLAPLTGPLGAVTTCDMQDTDCSDLLALSACDLLVCSVSSYSAWAAFLSDANYLWFEPNLHPHAEGVYSIWGHEAAQQLTGSPTRAACDLYQRATGPWHGRGIPVGMEGHLPAGLLDGLAARCVRRNPAADLISYGVMPRAPLPALEEVV